MTEISLTLNGEPKTGIVEPRTNLADFLRDGLDLTGTHLGCEHGVCGACTLLLDGAPSRSCIVYAVACEGAEVTTIEGLDDDDIMMELRVAFSREHALQCGFCTPGMLISARDLVLRLAEPDDQQIRVGMSGNLCRCTGYVGIVRAVTGVIAQRRARGIAATSDRAADRLGPVGSHYIAAAAAAPARAVAAGSTAARSAPRAMTFDPAQKPQSSFAQSFVVAYPREAVWDMFGRIEEVVTCLPGAALTEPPSMENLQGRIRVKVGPIAAEFAGTATMARDEATYSGCMRGVGSDARTNSATRGQIDYRLIEIEDARATRVDLTIGYGLTGLLAQVGRAGIVQDIARRLIAEFARNLESRLAGGGEAGASEPLPELNVGGLVRAAIGARLGALGQIMTKWIKR